MINLTIKTTYEEGHGWIWTFIIVINLSGDNNVLNQVIDEYNISLSDDADKRFRDQLLNENYVGSVKIKLFEYKIFKHNDKRHINLTFSGCNMSWQTWTKTYRFELTQNILKKDN